MCIATADLEEIQMLSDFYFAIATITREVNRIWPSFIGKVIQENQGVWRADQTPDAIFSYSAVSSAGRML